MRSRSASRTPSAQPRRTVLEVAIRDDFVCDMECFCVSSKLRLEENKAQTREKQRRRGQCGMRRLK